jgi:hypothetical protein
MTKRKNVPNSNVFHTVPFEGYKLGIESLKGKRVVAIPEKRLQQVIEQRRSLYVYDKTAKKEEWMVFKGDEMPVMFNLFEDKYGRMGDEAMYKLCYYEWKPIKQLDLFST